MHLFLWSALEAHCMFVTQMTSVVILISRFVFKSGKFKSLAWKELKTISWVKNLIFSMGRQKWFHWLLASVLYSEDLYLSPQSNMKVETLAQSRFFADNFNDILGKESRNEKHFSNPPTSRKVVCGCVMMYGPFPHTLTLFMTNIWEFSYLIYDLTKYTILSHDRYGWYSCPKH